MLPLHPSPLSSALPGAQDAPSECFRWLPSSDRGCVEDQHTEMLLDTGQLVFAFFPKGTTANPNPPSRVFSHLPLAGFSSVSVLERCLIRGRVGARAWRGETQGEDSEDQPGAGGWEWVGHVDPKACASLLPWPDLDSRLLPVSSQGPPLYLSMSQLPLLFLLLFFGHATQHVGILIPQPGIKPISPALEAWITREAPSPSYKESSHLGLGPILMTPF